MLPVTVPASHCDAAHPDAGRRVPPALLALDEHLFNPDASQWRLIELAGPDADPVLRDEVVTAWMNAQAYQLFTLQQVTSIVAGREVGAESSLNKLFWSELDVQLHETAMQLLGPEGELDGPWSRGFQFSLAGPIYAGTNEIQRNIVAERVLGLPRK